MRSSRILWLLLAAVAPLAHAQNVPIGTWTAYPSLQSAEAVTASETAVWAATTGGVFSIEVETGEIQRFTRVDGLSSVDASALTWDPGREAAWAGYSDGSIDRISASGAVQGYFDIQRAEQYPSRGVNRLRMQGDSLLIATDFGLVVFDAARAEVRDSYARLGTLEPATAVFDVLFAPLPAAAGPLAGTPGIWLATEEGVVWGPRAANLREPAAWTLDPGTPTSARALAQYGGRVWLGTASGAYARNTQGGWAQVIGGDRVYAEFIRTGDRFFAMGPFGFRELNAQAYSYFQTENYFDLAGATVGPDGAVWVADRREGLAAFSAFDGTGQVVSGTPARRVVPEGPVNNITRSLSIGPDGSVWVGHDNALGRSGVSRLLPDGSWEVFSSRETEAPAAQYYDTYVDDEGTLFAGTYGGGFVRISEEDGVTRFTEDNSSLLDAGDFEDYLVTFDAVRDRTGALWVTNGFSGRPFHVFQDGVWTALPAYPGLPNRDPRRLYTDRFGYLWFTFDETRGGGMGALDPRGTPTEPGDDRVFAIPGAGSGGAGLPHPNVRALAEDPDGRLWIGTERGLAFILSPGSAFGSDPALAQPVWARVPDGTDYFLRDLFIFDIDIDPAGQKWIGSTAGVFLTNAAGDEVLDQFTTANSPILSDEVLSVAVDPITGTAYFATSRGLIAYQSQATEPAAAGADLSVFPNPLRDPAIDVVVRDLPGSEDGPGALKVLTVDGQVVFEDETRGGTYVWSQPRDRRTGRPLAPGVYIVAVSGDGGASYGKLAVIR